MLLPGTISPAWLLFTVLISLIVLSETIENSKLDINFRFDLKQGNNGELRIRNFKDAREINRRAEDDSDESDKRPKEKDSSDNSDSEEAPKPKHNSNEKPNIKHSDSDGSDDDDNDSNEKLLSTRGLRPDEYEPEENPRVHAKYKQGDEEDDSDGSSRRRKRSIQALEVKEPEILAH